MTAIDLSNDLGLVACFLLTFNLCLGLLLAFRYNPWTHWPHRRFNYFRLHNWTAYVALAVAVAHPVVLLFIAKPRFGVLDLVLPLGSPQQPVVNTIGALALYALVFVVATSYGRHRMTRRTWKRLHYVAYGVAGSFVVHGLLADPSLAHHAVDWLDGEKVGVEICAGLLLALGMWRLRRALRPAGAAAIAARR